MSCVAWLANCAMRIGPHELVQGVVDVAKSPSLKSPDPYMDLTIVPESVDRCAIISSNDLKACASGARLLRILDEKTAISQ